MSHIVLKTFTCVDMRALVEFAADISALVLSIEEDEIFANHLVTAVGMNGALVVSLLPYGGSQGRDWDRSWQGIADRLKAIAIKHRAEWSQLTWGVDHEGSPLLETNRHKMRAGGVCRETKARRVSKT
jgi:hypothetical protein